MREVDLIFIVLEDVSEGEGIVVPGEPQILLLEVVLKVGDIRADSVPAEVLLLLDLG